jgi:hypothetical protein
VSWLVLVALAQAEMVEGRVRELGTGDPIAQALVEGPDDAVAKSNDQGHFQLDLDPGTVELVVFASGYEAQVVTVTVPTERPVVVFLAPGAVQAEIVVEARRELPHASGQVLDRERVEKAPGTYEDPVRLLQSLPSVAVTPEYSPSAGVLAVRGSAPQETRYFLDGVEIPYLYHFSNYSSVFHTRLLDELAFYPSTFGAQYGDATGAVIEATSRRPDPVKLHGGVNINFIMAGGYVTAPVGERGGISVSGRRSYQDGRQTDQYAVWPRFYDYLARYDQDLDEGRNHHLALTVFGAGDSYERFAYDAAEFDPLEIETSPRFGYDRDFHAVAARLDQTWGGVSSRSSVALVWDRWDGTLPSGGQHRVERYAWVRNDTQWQGDRAGLAGGLIVRPEQVQRVVETDRAWPELRDEAPLLARGVSADETISRTLFSGYIEPRLVLDQLRVHVGLRAQVDTRGNVGVDPRAALWWRPIDDLSLWAAAGRYHQSPSLDALSPQAGDPSLTLARSDQASAGLDWAVAHRWEVGGAMWGKNFRGVVMEAPGQMPQAVDGYAWGVEITTRYRVRERFFSWASLTLGHAERGGADFDYDQPFAVDLVASWDVRPRWNIGVRYRYAKGLPYTPVDDAIYQGATDTYTPVLGPTNSARLANYQKVDVHIERSFVLRSWTLVAYAEAWYVPAQNNEMYVVYSYDFSEQASVRGPTFLPLLGLRADL